MRLDSGFMYLMHDRYYNNTGASWMVHDTIIMLPAGLGHWPVDDCIGFHLHTLDTSFIFNPNFLHF